MNKQHIKTGTALAKAKKKLTIKIGLDVHAKQITVCRQEDGTLPQPAQKMNPAVAVDWIAKQVKQGHEVFTCYEAGPFGYGLHRQLTALGVTNYVIAPQCWDERGKKVKTDKTDARALVDRLDRFVRGNSHAFSVVRVPSKEQEQRRMLVRERQSALKERNRALLHARMTMLAQGIEAPGNWWRQAAWAKFSFTLPEHLREHIGFWRNMLMCFEEQRLKLSVRVQALSVGKKIPKGLGSLSAAQIGAEVMDWSRFKNRRQIGSYAGLCPSESSSGIKRIQGAISKHGNRRLRHYLVEAAWRLMFWQPNYPPVKKLLAAEGPRSRKRVAVAVARRLVVDLWRIETSQCSASKLGLELVESKIVERKTSVSKKP